MRAIQCLAQLIKYATSQVTHATSTYHWSNGLPQPQTVRMLSWRREELDSQESYNSQYSHSCCIDFLLLHNKWLLTKLYLKQLSFISSQFCTLEVWMGFIWFCAQDIIKLKQDWAGCLPEGSGEGFTSKIIQVFDRIPFLTVVGLRK